MKCFQVKENGTTVRAEVLGGLTTFITMAYIIVVNPAILAHAGIPTGPCTVATILTAVFGTLLMGLYANKPIAVAPYMGENAFIAFGLAAFGLSWQQRLGVVFLSGLLFAAITLFKVRAWLANAISNSLKHSFAAGIGLFLALVGLYESKIVTSGATGMPAGLLTGDKGLLRAPDVPLKIGNLHDPAVLLSIGGLLLIFALMNFRIPGALLIGICATGLGGYLLGFGAPIREVVALPFTGDYSLAPVAFQLDLPGVLHFALLPVLLTLFLMGFLDTLGTLMGVGAAGGFLNQKGEFPNIERPMLVDAVTCTFSGLVGTSTSGAFIESATGIREGARSGLAAVVTAGLFALSLFFIPLVEPLQSLQYAYAPALIAVGIMIMGSVQRIAFDDLTESAPAFISIVMMVFTYNIANGMTAGLVIHPLLKFLAGRRREIAPGSLILAGLCLLYFIAGLVH